jgi:sodium-dependent dicarboxylate transporter 2/3/5
MVCLPIIVVFLPITWLYLCRFGTPIPLSAVRFSSNQSVIRDERAALGPMSMPEKRVMIVAASTGLLWILRAPIDLGGFFLPGWSQLFPMPGAVHDSTVAMAMAILLFMLPSGKAGVSSRLLDWKHAARGTPWGIVFLLGGGFALAAGITDSGLAAWIGAWLAALGELPSWMLVVAVCVLTTAMTETTSNVATVLMLSPAVAAMAGEVGVHPYLLLIPMAVTSSFAFTLPVATPPNAIIFSSGWITIPQMVRAGILLDLIGLLIVPIAVYALGSGVFGY